MNVDSILISDFAESTDGKLTVVGVFNRIGPTKLPVQLATIAVSLVIHGHHGEAGTTHDGELRLIDGERNTLLTHPFKVRFADRSEAIAGIPLRSLQTVVLLAPTFPEAGPFAFEAYIDDTFHAAASFVVIEEQE